MKKILKLKKGKNMKFNKERKAKIKYKEIFEEKCLKNIKKMIVIKKQILLKISNQDWTEILIDQMNKYDEFINSMLDYSKEEQNDVKLDNNLNLKITNSKNKK